MTADEKRRLSSALDVIERHMKRIGELEAEAAAARWDNLATARALGGCTALAKMALHEVTWIRSNSGAPERGERAA